MNENGKTTLKGLNVSQLFKIQPFQGCYTRRYSPRIALTVVRSSSGAIRIQLLWSCQSYSLTISNLRLIKNKVDTNAPCVVVFP
jgi:hypothetical protein